MVLGQGRILCRGDLFVGCGRRHGKEETYNAFFGCGGTSTCEVEVNLGDHAFDSEIASFFAFEDHFC